MKPGDARARVLDAWAGQPRWRGQMAVSRDAYESETAFIFEVGLRRYIEGGDEGGIIPNCPLAIVTKATGDVAELPWHEATPATRTAARVRA